MSFDVVKRDCFAAYKDLPPKSNLEIACRAEVFFATEVATGIEINTVIFIR